ncbi:DUF4244 domain-containing protein [Cellulomonas fimi]|nr:DUF4244 domain-containing protein [Cellulomonas fimi]
MVGGDVVGADVVGGDVVGADGAASSGRGRCGASTIRRLRVATGDAGMATAEYAIATLAAVGFAGLLVVILKSGEVKALLTGIVRQALSL